MHEVSLEGVAVQRKGIVCIAGSPRRRSTLAEQDRKLDDLALRLVRKALPVRITCVHLYVSNRMIEYVVPILLSIFGRSILSGTL
jgi:hypothetical protein